LLVEMLYMGLFNVLLHVDRREKYISHFFQIVY